MHRWLSCLVVAGVADVTAGQGGIRATAGAGVFSSMLIGVDGRFTVARTMGRPRSADAHATYAGGEVDITLLMFHARVGYAHAVSAAVPAAKSNALTWSVGVLVPLPK